MKKIYTLILAALCAATMVAQQPNVVRTKEIKKAPANAASFSVSDIKNWSGEGSNTAVLAIKWTGYDNTLVFGYHFDGEKTGADMVYDIAANNPRFFVLAAGATAYGAAIGGFGWDADNNGFTLNDADGNAVQPDERGVYLISSTNNFDNYVSASDADYWNSGWMSKGYWSYWVATSPEKPGYASTGASGRKLTDNCWDMWMFSPFKGGKNDWGPLVSAPSNQTSTAVSDVNAAKTVANVKYVNLAGQSSSEAFSGVNIVVTTYTDGTTSAVKVIK